MECLQDSWPEPVVRVQSISDSGGAVIPDRYVKPPADRPSPDPPAGPGERASIPVVDIGGVGAAEAVAAACREWGFFQAVNHGVAPEVMRGAREAWRGFFHLPMEAKQRHANTPRTYEGYGSRLGVEKGAPLDWGDYYFLHFLPQSQHKWPTLPTHLRETTEEYKDQVLSMCRTVMRLLSSGLGLPEDYLQRAFGGDDIGVCMRTNFYPKCPQPELALGLSAHSDPGGITVLLVDDRVRGLQVRKGGAWVTVDPVPDAFIVNVGDQVQVLSNGDFRSVEHRVMVNSEAERLSIAFFYNPRGDISVGPATELVAPPERPARYGTMTFNEYRMAIRKRGPKGKSLVESLKTS